MTVLYTVLTENQVSKDWAFQSLSPSNSCLHPSPSPSDPAAILGQSFGFHIYSLAFKSNSMSALQKKGPPDIF